jgi:hypothetical protein
MKRRFFTALSAVSLLLCAGVCLMWVRGCFIDDTYGWYTDHEARKHSTVTSGQGGVWLCRTEGYPHDMLQGFRSRSIPDWDHPGLLGVVINQDRRRVAQGFLGFWTYYRARGVTVAQVQFWGLPCSSSS